MMGYDSMQTDAEYQRRLKRWLDSRATFIGASESPAILGYGYSNQSPFAVWHSKQPGYVPQKVDKDLEWRFRVGHHMEPLLAQSFEEQTGMAVCRNEFAVVRHEEYRFIGATLDGFVPEDDGPTAGWEAKDIGQFAAHEWEDGPPMRVAIQVQHQMACTGADETYVCASINKGIPQFEIIERDQEFIDALIPILVDFWQDHVTTGKAPEVDGSEATYRAIKRLHPDDTGEVVDVSEHAELIDRLREVNATLKAVEAEKRKLTSELCLALGDASYGHTADGQYVSWTTQERKAYTVKASSTRVFRIRKTLPKGTI